MLEKYIKSKRKRFIIKRILKSIPVILLATFIAFAVMRVGDPDPARRILGLHATEEMIEEFNAKHGLNKPLYRQYIDWMVGLFRGDLGTSLRYDEPITELIKPKVSITFQLMALALSISIVLGIGTGVIGALNHNTWIDYLASMQALFWRSAPSFWVGTIFLLIFAFYLNLFPTGGYENIYYLILPAIVIGIRLQAIIARLTRSSMLNVLDQDYIKTAQTKGLKKHIVIIKHALRNALIPVVTVIAMRLPWLFGYGMITEQIFNIPGMGRFILTATLSRDFIAVQSSILIMVIIAVIANLGADIAYTFIDPRIDLGSHEEV
ncbi:MAG: ABC transporter permease [Candidatus Thermoplasmatota archaeon]|nr:ABC transporter permease [Candidatus Thermoplasmatota archaeon]